MLRCLLTIIASFFLMATAYVGYLIEERQDVLRKVPGHLYAWSAEQALSESRRLERQIATYQLGLTDADAGQVGLRPDIMFGRIERHGALHAYMGSNPHRTAPLSTAEGALKSVERRLEEPKTAVFKEELKALAKLGGPLTALASSTALSADTARIAGGRNSLRRFHFICTPLAGGLIVCSICLILLLLHKNRLLNRAQIGMRRLADDLRETSKEILAQNERLAHMARHDALTGLANRFLFRQELDRRLLVARSNRASVAVLFLDLDGFKDINDSFGHDVGDCLLVKISERLKEAASPEDMTCRLGGNEFAVLTETTSEQDASERAQGLLAKMAGPVHIDGRELSIGTSIGVSFARGDLDSDVVLKHADLAVHEAKKLGRGQACLFLPEMHSRFHARKCLENDLRKALPNGEFEVYYQAQADAQSGMICAYEALLRWNHPTKGKIPPSDFVPIAEEMGLVHEIGDWVLRTACSEASRWRRPLRIAVNLSAVQFRNKMLLQQVNSALSESGLEPSRLELEITESTLMDCNGHTLELLTSLKAAGVQIAMDDFGMGYSSLGALRGFPFDKIKIDRSFISDIPSRRDALTIVELITGVARSLGMATTAEGVETEEQLACVKRLGCDYMQGFLIGEPAPANRLSHLYGESDLAHEDVDLGISWSLPAESHSAGEEGATGTPCTVAGA